MSIDDDLNLEDNLSRHLHHYVQLNPDRKTVLLDGDFTADDLLAIYAYMVAQDK